jgi:hypothetical protein
LYTKSVAANKQLGDNCEATTRTDRSHTSQSLYISALMIGGAISEIKHRIEKVPKKRTASYHVGHTTNLITKVKQHWARLVLGWVTAQMTSRPGAVRRCTRILWPGKGSEKTAKEVIPPVCLKYRGMPVLRYFEQTGGITSLGVFSDAFPGHKMRVHLLTARLKKKVPKMHF